MGTGREGLGGREAPRPPSTRHSQLSIVALEKQLTAPVQVRPFSEGVSTLAASRKANHSLSKYLASPVHSSCAEARTRALKFRVL